MSDGKGDRIWTGVFCQAVSFSEQTVKEQGAVWGLQEAINDLRNTHARTYTHKSNIVTFTGTVGVVHCSKLILLITHYPASFSCKPKAPNRERRGGFYKWNKYEAGL